MMVPRIGRDGALSLSLARGAPQAAVADGALGSVSPRPLGGRPPDSAVPTADRVALVDGPLAPGSSRRVSAAAADAPPALLPLSFDGGDGASARFPLGRRGTSRTPSPPAVYGVYAAAEDAAAEASVACSPDASGLAAFGAAGGRRPYPSRGLSDDGASAGVASLRFHDCFAEGAPLYGGGRANAAKAGSGSGDASIPPGPDVTAVAVSDDASLVAYGDRAGRLFLLRAAALARSGDGGVSGIGLPEADSGSDSDDDDQRRNSRGAYEPFVFRTAYTAVIDPLNSVEVGARVNAVAFLPSLGPTGRLLLTTNEKVPKLWRVVVGRPAPPPFRAVDRVDARTVGPLTVRPPRHAAAADGAPGAPQVSLKECARFAALHEYTVHSLCAAPDGLTFATADDLVVRQWHVDHPATSLELCSLRPGDGEEVKESLAAVACFPHEPSLLFAATTGGNVRVLDLRESLRCRVGAQVFSNPPRGDDGAYAGVACALSACALSPCRRYIAGRDFLTVPLWDTRAASSSLSAGATVRSSSCGSGGGGGSCAGALPVRRWALHPQMGAHLERLYASELLFEKFGVAFSPAGATVLTGSLDGRVLALDVATTGAATTGPPSDGGGGGSLSESVASLPRSSSVVPTGSAVRAFGLPAEGWGGGVGGGTARTPHQIPTDVWSEAADASTALGDTGNSGNDNGASGNGGGGGGYAARVTRLATSAPVLFHAAAAGSLAPSVFLFAAVRDRVHWLSMPAA